VGTGALVAGGKAGGRGGGNREGGGERGWDAGMGKTLFFPAQECVQWKTRGEKCVKGQGMEDPPCVPDETEV
jgi:hypothetical protein